ncbi:MAG: ABC transporter ATP-binding protein [Caldilineaceae bacterium]
MRPYKTMVILGLVTTVLPVIMELVVPRLLQYVIDQGLRVQNMSNIYWGAGLMFGAAFLGAIATLGQGVARAQLSQGIAFDMRNLLFGHIQSLSYADLDLLQTGQLMTRISSDVDTVRMFSSAGLALLIRALLMVFGSMIMLFVTDWELAAIMLVLLAIMAVLLRYLLGKAQPLFAVVQQKLAALNTIVQENLAGVRVVKAYVRERYEIDRFNVGNVAYRDQNIQVGRLMALALPSLALLTNLGIVSIIWWGGTSVINNRLSIGELIAFNNYLMIGMAPLLLLSNILMMVSRAEASAARYFEVLDAQPRIQKVAAPFQGTAGQRHAVRGRVVFDHASFHYDSVPLKATNGQHAHDAVHGNGKANGQVATVTTAATTTAAGYHPSGSTNGHADSNGKHNGQGNGVPPVDRYGVGAEEVLDAVSFTAEPGQQIAILGATGSGKSTLINLLPRFYDVTGGAIRIDDVDVREWEPAVLRRNIGMVLQETTLFSGTIRDNIAYGRPDASFDEVIAAAKAAQAHDFISAWRMGTRAWWRLGEQTFPVVKNNSALPRSCPAH